MLVRKKVILGASLVLVSLLLMGIVIGNHAPAAASPLLGITPTPVGAPTDTPEPPTATPEPVISTPVPQDPASTPIPTLTATPVPILPISGAERPSGAPLFAIMLLAGFVFGVLTFFRRKVRQ